MKQNKNPRISNLDELEQEIARLQHESSEIKRKMDARFIHLEKHFLSVCVHSFMKSRYSRGTKSEEEQAGENIFSKFICRITDQFSTAAEDKLRNLIRSFSQKKQGL